MLTSASLSTVADTSFLVTILKSVQVHWKNLALEEAREWSEIIVMASCANKVIYMLFYTCPSVLGKLQ